MNVCAIKVNNNYTPVFHNNDLTEVLIKSIT